MAVSIKCLWSFVFFIAVDEFLTHFFQNWFDLAIIEFFEQNSLINYHSYLSDLSLAFDF